MNALEMLARGGYAARGAVYAVVGGFAVAAATVGGDLKSAEETPAVLLSQPFGRVLVALLALGLFGYAFWRVLQGLLDTDSHGRNPKGLAIRAAMLASAAAYLAFGASAAAVAFGPGGGGGGAGDDLMRRAIAVAGATPVAAAIAAVFLAAAAGQAVRAVRATFLRWFRVDPDKRRLVRRVGRAGILARAAVFLILAGLMGLRAATASNAGEPPPNLAEVLAAVAALPAGTPLLAALGLGLVAFAAYSLAAALYRSIDVRPLVRAAGGGGSPIGAITGR